jgi:diaminohydroxyphosphoribosylaminopyrimidine deaminase/5-amino-6-(5-phosphoribosylamino)uracil reductase
VLLDDDGAVIAEGFHRGAGTPHAEAVALDAAGERARGATAVVTLEPCRHTGRTGPCAQRLVEAGVARVVFAQSDPNPMAAGGATLLRGAGVEVVAGVMAGEAETVNREWSAAMRLQRPFVTWKTGVTLDGRVAAADGTSRWITSAASRRDAHALRAKCDAILVGTGTALADDPALTAREVEAARQPLRVVAGLRDLPPSSRLLDDAAETLVLRTRDPHEVLAALWRRECRHVLLEGGPTLAAAFVGIGLVDEVVAYVAPTLLGAGPSALGDLGIRTIADAPRWCLLSADVIGDAGSQRDVRLTLTPGPPRPGTPEPHRKDG